MSEVLGLAWEDLDLDAGTAQIRRGACYTSSVGMVLGSTKTSGAEGVHYLAPVSAAHLRKRRAEPQTERTAFGGDWRTHAYDGEAISMVFTAVHGGLANRQAVTKEIRRAAKIAGLDPEGLASHSGRRTVVTALYADGGLDLALVARHGGHSDPSTTAEYVRSLGHRPSNTAAQAARLLDPRSQWIPAVNCSAGRRRTPEVSSPLSPAVRRFPCVRTWWTSCASPRPGTG